jgi:hypothetical protein
MTRSKGWSIVEAGEPVITPGRSGGVVIPETVTVAVVVDGVPMRLEYIWSSADLAMGLVGMRGEDEHGRPHHLPARVRRQVAGEQVAVQVVRHVGRQLEEYGLAAQAYEEWEQGGYKGPRWQSTAERLGGGWSVYQEATSGLPPLGRTEAGTAEALARGRGKGQQDMVTARRRAATVARALIEQGVSGEELYQKVAAELGVTRTTAYGYLSRAGVIGKGRQR